PISQRQPLCIHNCPFVSFSLPPATSPLFPYTTLFRSRVPAARIGNDYAMPGSCLSKCSDTRTTSGSTPSRPACREKRLATSLRRDRKSTRLNSSHVKNSYAVFCLKKKKPTEVGN